ncbi:hypothetical protein CYMTET_9805 [Cymbomonas tetramitiformis]|uniref:malate dehydrogenase n=1 Tax=Cymbomonas tetramitiformis TaxID=36881 RepID=A0AAE0GQX7_9CHLO|nr:hypothetical protein CYMTET_9805 [Cymbomonas tetramitiformis]
MDEFSDVELAERIAKVKASDVYASYKLKLDQLIPVLSEVDKNVQDHLKALVEEQRNRSVANDGKAVLQAVSQKPQKRSLQRPASWTSGGFVHTKAGGARHEDLSCKRQFENLDKADSVFFEVNRALKAVIEEPSFAGRVSEEELANFKQAASALEEGMAWAEEQAQLVHIAFTDGWPVAVEFEGDSIVVTEDQEKRLKKSRKVVAERNVKATQSYGGRGASGHSYSNNVGQSENVQGQRVEREQSVSGYYINSYKAILKEKESTFFLQYERLFDKIMSDTTATRRVAQIAGHFDARDEVTSGRILNNVTSSPTGFKVALLGAAGGIGQPLALLLKKSPLIDVLNLYDIVNTPGVACDLSHIDTPCKVQGFAGAGQLGAALEGCHLVIIPAGVPRKPGMTRDDLFNTNAGIVRTLAEGVAKYCPRAVVNVISNPVNSTVPIVAEVMKARGVYDPAKLMGVTTLDVLRARTFVAEAIGVPPGSVDLPVIGGHAGITILPLLSQATPSFSFTDDEVAKLTKRIQNGGTEVVDAKAGAGSATLSMAQAALRFGESCLRGLKGDTNVLECAYVQSTVTSVPYFASKILLGRSGVEATYPLGPLSASEREGLNKLLPELKANIEKGIAFAHK